METGYFCAWRVLSHQQGWEKGKKPKIPHFFLHNSAKKSLGNRLQRLALQEDWVVGDPQGTSNAEGNSSMEQLLEKSARTSSSSRLGAPQPFFFLMENSGFIAMRTRMLLCRVSLVFLEGTTADLRTQKGLKRPETAKQFSSRWQENLS